MWIVDGNLLLIESRVWVSGGSALACAESNAHVATALNKSEISEAAWRAVAAGVLAG